MAMQALLVAYSHAASLLAELSSETSAILKLFPEDPAHCGNLKRETWGKVHPHIL